MLYGFGLLTQSPDYQHIPDGYDLINLAKKVHSVEIRIISHAKPSVNV